MMKRILSFILAAFMLLSGAVLAEEAKAPLSIAEQGMFSAGGTVTEPVEGDYNPTTKSQGMKQLMAGGGVALIGMTLVPLLTGLFG